MQIMCLIFTKNNYFYIGRLIDESNPDRWAVDSECEEHGSFTEVIHDVTHFCIPCPVEIEE